MRIVWILCIFFSAAVRASATDNSFKLDFNGDGRTDIALYREGSRGIDAPQPSYWLFMNTANWSTVYWQWGRSLDVPAPADYDGDGKTDVGIFRWWDYERGDTNEWWLSRPLIAPGHLVINSLELGYNKYSRNYLGDSRAEIGQLYQTDISQNPGETCFVSVYLIADDNGFALRKNVGDACNVNPTPVPGDYDGDGHSEIAVYVNHEFKVWIAPYTPGYTTPALRQTMDIDIPAPGDYDGDGRTDFAGVKLQNGRMIWRYRKSSTGAQGPDIDFGYSTDTPVPGDYDGDGITDIAVFRSTDRTWWILNSSLGLQGFQFGLSTDVPLAANVIPFSPVRQPAK